MCSNLLRSHISIGFNNISVEYKKNNQRITIFNLPLILKLSRSEYIIIYAVNLRSPFLRCRSIDSYIFWCAEDFPFMYSIRPISPLMKMFIDLMKVDILWSLRFSVSNINNYQHKTSSFSHSIRFCVRVITMHRWHIHTWIITHWILTLFCNLASWKRVLYFIRLS